MHGQASKPVRAAPWHILSASGKTGCMGMAMPFHRFRIQPSASMVTARAVPCRSDAIEASGDMVHAASRSGLVVGPGITVRGAPGIQGWHALHCCLWPRLSRPCSPERRSTGRKAKSAVRVHLHFYDTEGIRYARLGPGPDERQSHLPELAVTGQHGRTGSRPGTVRQDSGGTDGKRKDAGRRMASGMDTRVPWSLANGRRGR